MEKESRAKPSRDAIKSSLLRISGRLSSRLSSSSLALQIAEHSRQASRYHPATKQLLDDLLRFYNLSRYVLVLLPIRIIALSIILVQTWKVVFPARLMIPFVAHPLRGVLFNEVSCWSASEKFDNS
jgi:hypothetical protein